MSGGSKPHHQHDAGDEARAGATSCAAPRVDGVEALVERLEAPGRACRAARAGTATTATGRGSSAPAAIAISDGGERRVARRRLVERELRRQQVRALGEHPADDDRGHGARGGERGRAVALASHTSASVRAPGRAGDEHARQPGARGQAVEEVARVASAATSRPPSATRAGERRPEPSARARNARTRSGCPARTRVAGQEDRGQVRAGERRRARPISAEVGFSHERRGSPAALPTGTRPEAIPPIAAPRKNGISTRGGARTARRARAPRGSSPPGRAARTRRRGR